MDLNNKTFKFFITPIYPYGNDHYYHEVIALAEGLQELGFNVISNVDYWWQPEKGEFLLKGDLKADFDIGIYDYRYVTAFEHLLYRKGYPNFDRKKIHVLVDRNDWISPIWKNENSHVFNLILSGNLFTGVEYPASVKPWAIGLTNRIMKQIDLFYDPSKVLAEAVGHNFRVPHNMRKYVLDNLKNAKLKFPLKLLLTDSNQEKSEIDSYYSLSTTSRHDPAYFKLINEQLLFLTFGGYYEYKPLAYQPYGFIDKFKRKPYYWLHNLLRYKNKDIAPSVFVFQYDNFRFWEVLYAASCAVNLDFDYWRFKLPVMPKAGEHYLSIKGFNVNLFSSELNGLNNDQIRKIGENGRKWVAANYSPLAQAQRLIAHLKEL